MTGVSDEFRDAAIEDYLVFILQLGWAPSEIFYGDVDEIKGLEVWRDMFSKELKRRFGGYADRRAVLMSVLHSLDQGKRYVMEGYDWLRAELGLPAS